MIQPTVGRSVWFRHVSHGAEDQPWAAIIAQVNDDRNVNLAVFNGDGCAMAVTNVPLIQEGDPRPEEGHFAEWMPYQKAVAAGEIAPTLHAAPKTGAPEKKAAKGGA